MGHHSGVSMEQMWIPAMPNDAYVPSGRDPKISMLCHDKADLVAWRFSMTATRAVPVECAASEPDWLGSRRLFWALDEIKRQSDVAGVFKDFWGKRDLKYF